MKQSEDFLQELVEQLENGEPVEACVVGLPVREAEVVHLIDAMRNLSFPEEDEALVTAHEGRLLAATKAQFPAVSAQEAQTPVTAVFLSHIQSWLDRLPIQRELVFGLAAVLFMVVFAVVWTMLSGRPDGEQPIVVETSTEDVAAPAPSIDVADDLSEPSASEDEQPDEEAIVASVPPTPQGPTIYIPLVSNPLNFTAQTAVIDNIQGIVEIQAGDGTWAAVNHTGTIETGQRVRTGNLSQVTLTFYDGSQVRLSANTEISIDELNALRPEDGYRTVVMTQWVGDSSHSVQFRNDGGSRYEVKTPSGSGVARGTKFHVMVTADLLTRYTVTDGKVDVAGAGRTVSVTAGKLSTILSGEVPEEPAFIISGEGEVEARGDVWIIARHTFLTDDRTIVVGDPLVGDLVSVEGHLLADGSRVADRIVLVRRAISSRFTLTGEVEAMGASWTVAGSSISVDDSTIIDEAISIGDTVRVEGVILSDSRLLAERISLIDDTPGLPFEFSGVVRTIGDDGWIISGKAIAVDASTVIDDDIAVGNVVRVSGTILADDTWLAGEITLLVPDDLPTFAFTGRLDSMDPWRVAGIEFETRPWTIIAPDLETGDMVRVSGTILSDGTFVATSIVPLDDVFTDTIIFAGIVSSMDPWVVDGLRLVVTDETRISGSITIGSFVLVRARLMPDGSWTVLSIRLLFPAFGHGCFTFATPVIAFGADFIRVRHWDVDIERDGRIDIRGDIRVDSIILLPVCTGWDGSTIILGDIIVIYEPIIIIIDDGGPPPSGCRGSKCGDRGSKRS